MSTGYALISMDEYNKIKELAEETRELAGKLTESYEYAKWHEKQITRLKLELNKKKEKTFKEIAELNQHKERE